MAWTRPPASYQTLEQVLEEAYIHLANTVGRGQKTAIIMDYIRLAASTASREAIARNAIITSWTVTNRVINPYWTKQEKE